MVSVKLIGGSMSPFKNRVQIALNLKSIDYEFLRETFGSKSELLLKSNPVYKKSPVLLHGDKSICESLIIVQYIDEMWTSGPSILPSDPYDRATARFWGAYIDDKCFPSVTEIQKAEGEEERMAALEKIVSMLVLLEDFFVKSCEGKAFFGGDTIGYVDIALGSFVGWFKAMEKMFNVKLLDKSKTPCLAEWAKRFCSDDALKDVIPETDKIMEFLNMLLLKVPPRS